ncbi:hypothetical protein AUC70_11235 [Methyloceanibacter stevinii]|uniref:Restriction endonuclease n=1 Tax=Methyloceanibacter stevinii TaxID=1774970 RepID=A0A1E3VKS2_9HYPH|nr:hypothetical protein AUC70_11235 [Methyloceanibacter stevinii]
MVNAWLSALPAPDQQELIARMRRGSDREFDSGIVELVVHTLLVRLGFEVEVHPQLSHTSRRPDFLAKLADTDQHIFVEVTTMNPPERTTAERNREDMLFETINRARLPAGCYLGYELIEGSPRSPALRRVASTVEQWAQRNNQLARKAIVSEVFDFDGWTVELQLIAGESKKVASRAIGLMGTEARWIAPHLDLRSALERKARRYGELNAPYLIVAAEAREDMWNTGSSSETMLDALLGDRVFRVVKGRRPTPGRARNGFWFARGAPCNQNVSGVLTIPTSQLWALRSTHHQALLAINPWAQHLLPDEFRRLRNIGRTDDGWSVQENNLLADLLDVPEPWPPEEQ